MAAGGDAIAREPTRPRRVRRPARCPASGCARRVIEEQQRLRPGRRSVEVLEPRRPRSSRRARSWRRAAAVATGSTSSRRPKPSSRWRSSPTPCARTGAPADAVVEPGPALPATGSAPPCASASTATAGSASGPPAATLVPVDACLVAHPLARRARRRRPFPGADEVTLRCSGGHRRAARPSSSPIVPAPPPRCPADVPASGRRRSIHEVVAGAPVAHLGPSFFQTRPDGAAALVGRSVAGRRSAHRRRTASWSTPTPASGSFAATGRRPDRGGGASSRPVGLSPTPATTSPAEPATVVDADVEPGGGRRRPTLVIADPARRRPRPPGRGRARRDTERPGSCSSAAIPPSLARDAAARRRRLRPRAVHARRPVPAHPPRRGRDPFRSA